jgi:hypothetical protein
LRQSAIGNDSFICKKNCPTLLFNSGVFREKQFPVVWAYAFLGLILDASVGKVQAKKTRIPPQKINLPDALKQSATAV